MQWNIFTLTWLQPGGHPPPLVACQPFQNSLLLSLGLLLFNKLFSIALEPSFQIGRSFFQFIIIQQSPPQGFKECAGTNVVSEFLVGFMLGAFRNRNKKFFVKSRQPALDATQTQSALTGDGPVGQSQRQVVKRFGFELSQQRPFE